MTPAQRSAVGQLVGVLLFFGAGAAAAAALERRRNPWVSLRGRGHRQRVFVDDDGRIERGLPEQWRGVRLADMPRVSREEAKTRRRLVREEARLFPRARSTFATKRAAVRELLDANPQLRTFYEAHFGRDDEAFLRWQANGRRGPKPTRDYDDGRLDGINATWDLQGARQANNWTEALYATVPESRRWQELEERLPVLEEATGLTLELPPAAARLQRRRDERARFREGAEHELADVYGRAREAAIMHTGGDVDDVAADVELEEAPF